MIAPASHRVTAQHIHGLAAADQLRGGNTILADTDAGIRYVAASSAFEPEVGVRRLLLTLEDLAADAVASGLSMSQFLRADASRIAAELNDVIADNWQEENGR